MEVGLVLAVAFIADLLLGDPPYRLHPVRLIGRFIETVEGFLRKGSATTTAGAVLLILTAGLTLAIYIAGHHLLAMVALESVWDVYWVYSMIAFRDMFDHVEPVKNALEREDLASARKGTALIVGRITDRLGVEELSRATVESLAEGFVDGLLSPLVWFVAGATLAHLAGYNEVVFATGCMITCRAVNTLDSMVGYRSPEYILLGRPSARADDLLNFIPARLSIPVLFLASTLLGYNALRGLKIALRDRLKHPSPNSAHPESFIAGVLNIKLGGPALYSDGLHERPTIGGNSTPTPRHIEDAKKITMLAGTIAVLTAVFVCMTLY